MTHTPTPLFQAALYRRLYLAPSLIHGHGVFAQIPLRKDEMIGRYQGPRTEHDDTYVLWVEDDDGWRGIDGRNLLKFVNHSSRPNVEFVGDELYALRDIAPGEELAFDYGEDWADDSHRSL